MRVIIERRWEVEIQETLYEKLMVLTKNVPRSAQKNL